MTECTEFFFILGAFAILLSVLWKATGRHQLKGYQPKATNDSPTKPPSNPPNQGSSGKK